MKIIKYCGVALLAGFLIACNNTEQKNEEDQSNIPADSTIFGKLVLDEMGQSTFAIRPEGTDTILQLVLDNNEGPAKIYGAKEEGSKWAITIRNRGTDNEALGTAINISQVKKFTKACHIENGVLILNDSDHVNIILMDDDSLVFRTADGKTDRFYRNLNY